MTNLFNINSIHESNNVIRDLVVESNKETYLFSALSILSEMNASIDKSTKDLYISINEAENRSEENEYFCKYFTVFKDTILNATSKVNEITNRFLISSENIIDSNKDLLSMDLVNNFDSSKEFKMELIKFDTKKLLYKKYPVFNPMDIFRKEFESIGLLLQDKSITASDKDKLNIIASVYNNLVKEMGGKWYKNAIKDIIGEHNDDDHKCESFAKCIYSELVKDDGKKSFEIIDKSAVYDAKSSLDQYPIISSNIQDMANDLISQLNNIAEEIGNMLFRNQDGKLKIRSDRDDVKDRDYTLDTYSMNQFDIFLKAKTNQINQLCNLYIIAFSIKLDTIIDFINQNKDILNTVKNKIYPEIIPSKEDIDDEVDPNKDEDNNGINDDLEDIDNNGIKDEEEYNTDDNEENDDESNKEDNDDSGKEEDNNNESEEENNENDESSDGKIESPEEFKESYLFESDLFFLEQYDQDLRLLEFIREEVLNEEDQNTNNDNKANNPLQKAQDLVNNNSNKIMEVIRAIMNQLAKLWNKFKDKFINQYEKKIKFLKDNKNAIIGKPCPPFDGNLNTLVININNFNDINVVDLNYNAMKDSLVDDETFIKKYYSKFTPDSKESFSDKIKNSVIDNNTKDTIASPNEFDKRKAQWYDWCLNYNTVIDEIKKMTDIMQKGRDSASKIAKAIGESTTVEEYYTDMYFNEMENNTSEPKKSPEAEKKEKSNDKANIKTYFKVSSKVIAAKMTLAQKIFNEYYQALTWIAKRNGAGSDNSNNNTDNNAQNNNQTNETQDVQFN